MQDLKIGDEVTVTSELNSGRYRGQRATVSGFATGGRVVVRLARITVGLDPPDGLVWLRPDELQPGSAFEVPADAIAAALEGAKVDSVEVVDEGSYIVVRFGALTLYADDPTLYRAAV